MNTNEKYALANLVMAHALKNGAEQVSVSVNASRRSDIDIRDQKIDKLKESVRNSLTVELFVEKKYSAHSYKQVKERRPFPLCGRGNRSNTLFG